MPDEPKQPAHDQFKPIKYLLQGSDNAPTFPADGAWGSLNHLHVIRIGFYTDNPATPPEVVQDVDPVGNPKGDLQFKGLDNSDYYLISRQFHCNVTLSLISAIQVHQMLGNFIRTAQQQMKDQAADMRAELKAAEERKASQLIK